jgi:hypothetical protein
MYSVFVMVSTVAPIGVAVAMHEIEDIPDEAQANRLSTLLADKSNAYVSIVTVVCKK